MPILWKILLAAALAIFGYGAFGGGLVGCGVGGSLLLAALCVSGFVKKNK
jgi:hypothetical protein